MEGDSGSTYSSEPRRRENLRLPGEISTTITSQMLLPIPPGKPLKTPFTTYFRLHFYYSIIFISFLTASSTKQRKPYLSETERYYVFTRMLSSVSQFVIILWIFRGFGCPWGWNPSKHKRGNADGEFQNNMILSRRLSGPNKIYLNINALRGVHYLEVLSKYWRNTPIPFTSITEYIMKT